MKIMNWNIEWMNHWFVGGTQAALRSSYKEGNKVVIADVDALCKRVAAVITALDPDVLTVEEGPSDPREMELYARTYLADSSGIPRFDVLGGLDGDSQKVYALIKRQGLFRNATLPSDEITLGLRDPWNADIDGDLILEGYDFPRTPLVVDGRLDSTNEIARIVVLHTKSKFVNRGNQLWNDPNAKQEYVVAAVKNRRRISAEAMRTRLYLDEIIEADPNRLIVVTGDFNDGPGVDYFEKWYLTHNVTDILLGSTYYPDLLFTHALIGRVSPQELYTAIFDDFVDEIPNRRILLDHILVSPALRGRFSKPGIAHQEYDANTLPHGTERERRPSDHRPVFIEIA